MNYNKRRKNTKRNSNTSTVITCTLLVIVIILAILIFTKDKERGCDPANTGNVVIYQTPTPSAVITSPDVPTDKATHTSFITPESTSADPSEPTPTITNKPEYTYGMPVPENTPVDDSYFEDAIFIGDSRLEDMSIYTGMRKISTFYTQTGLTATGIINSNPEKLAKFNIKGEKLTLKEGITKYNNFSKVYIMMGFNELGWSDGENFANYYALVLNMIREAQPKAEIYVMCIIPVARKIIGSGTNPELENNERIASYNSSIQKMCEKHKFHYLNVQEVLVDSEGYLPDGAASDGIHLDKPYSIKWLDYVKSHTVEVKK